MNKYRVVLGVKGPEMLYSTEVEAETYTTAVAKAAVKLMGAFPSVLKGAEVVHKSTRMLRSW